MKKFIVPAIAILFLFSACSDSKKKAFDFSENLTAISKTLNSKGKEFGAELQLAMHSNDYSKLASISTSLNDFIAGKLTELKNTKDVAGSEKLRTSMIGFLEFEKTMINKAFTPFGKLNANSTQEEKDAALQTMLKATEDEGTYLLKVQEAQKEYAKKNGFLLK